MQKPVCLTALILSISVFIYAQNFRSNHFTIQKLADGVYAAISKNGGYAICNAGIIDLGDATLIFDPFMTPEAAEDLKKASLELTGHPVKYVVNSHFHNDHIGGNQVFSSATIISTELTRELIAKVQPQEIAEDKTGAPIELERIKKNDESVMTPHQLEENIMWKGYYEALVTSNSELKTILPDVTFKEQLKVEGSKRTVLLLCYGKGHTVSDLFLYLPGDQVAFLGDLLFIQNQPWLDDGDPVHWKTYLDSISHLQLKIVVPGHGPVGTPADFATMKLYFKTVKDAATAYFKKGTLPENDSTLKSPPPFDKYFLSGFYKGNVISEYGRMYKKQKQK